MKTLDWNNSAIKERARKQENDQARSRAGKRGQQRRNKREETNNKIPRGNNNRQ